MTVVSNGTRNTPPLYWPDCITSRHTRLRTYIKSQTAGSLHAPPHIQSSDGIFLEGIAHRHNPSTFACTFLTTRRAGGELVYTMNATDMDAHMNHSEQSEDESEHEAPIDLMVTTRARRSNAGNRMATLLAKSAEEEEWGEEWEEAPNEEEFQGGDVNEQHDYNMDSSTSEEDEDGDDDDDAGEKELRKAERQEKTKKRKPVTNPFAARVAAVARKKVRLDVPRAHSPTNLTPRPKKKSERASWLPTEEDGPVRASARQQTVANKEATLSKLMEKDKRRDDTLAMMKAAEARKKKDEPKPLTQAERLAEAARNERINKKTLHRWEEAEEARAAERQAKLDALKNRQMEGHSSDAPSIECLDEKLNKGTPTADSQSAQEDSKEPSTTQNAPPDNSEHTTNGETPTVNQDMDNHIHQSQDSSSLFQVSTSAPHMPSLPTSLPQAEQIPHQPWTAASQASGGDVFMGGDIFMGSHGMSFPNNTMFTPSTQDSFLFGIDQYAQTQQPQNTSDLPQTPSPKHPHTTQHTQQPNQPTPTPPSTTPTSCPAT
ncbi:YL1 nuclear protein-domain-containing protein [Phaeosphaeriaceae sp. PMI808]|nr:YL1 nuclear protein-domain-containing protein [Phaeosphaeriaceae sp. PMI808]